MRTRMAWLLVVLALASATVVTWSLTLGQPPKPAPTSPDTGDPGSLPPPQPPLLKTVPKPGDTLPEVKTPKAGPKRNLSSYTPLQKQMYLSMQRGADWLFRANRSDGRFDYGYLPALSTVMEGDHYLRQVGAAFALARAARFTGDDRFAARAQQAILTLLGDTSLDPNDKTVRHTTLPAAVVHRLAAAGLLVLAIHELPNPEKDLLDQSDQLCNYIRRQQRPDGSLALMDDPQSKDVDSEGVNYYPGEALYGLMRSTQHRPAAWKVDLVRKALGYYRPWWQAHKSMVFVPWQTAAFTEAYLQTKEQPFADFVFEMNDWLCGLQYERLDPRHPLWIGGFMSWADGKAVESPPQVLSASYGESLAEACRVARQAVDLPRYKRYSEALERCLQYVSTLQYTEGTTQHFAAWYRPRLVGGFHASDQDGNLRIDYTQHAVSAMAQYLAYVAKP